MKIGKGTYSKVYKQQDKAIKKYKNKNNDGIPSDMIREVSTLVKINSPYIISILKADFNYIILPLYEADLTQYLKLGKRVNIKNFMYSVFSGIHALHSLGIVHRDIKPSNILVKNENCGVLIDLGFSKNLECDRRFGEKSLEIITSWYRPPEIIDGRKSYSFEVDVWSAGCILAELHLEKNLFNLQSNLEILDLQCYILGTPFDYFKNIKTKNYKGVFYETFEKYGDDFCKLLNGMLKINHKERFSIAQCLNSDYFNNTWILQENLEIYKNYLQMFFLNIKIDDKEIIRMRQILVLWILETCTRHDSTYFRSVLILDKFISKNKTLQINKSNFQLVGMACIWIASKIESIMSLTKKEIIYSSDDSFTSEELEKMEKIILIELQFDLMTPILSNYLPLYSNELQLNNYNINLFNKYLHICSIFPEIYKYKFSDIAIICGQLSLNKKIDTNETLSNDILKWIELSKDFEAINDKFKNK